MPDTPEYNVHILVNLDIVAITIGHDPVTWEANEDENSNTYTISGNKVKWLVEPYVDQILQYNDIDVLPSDIIVDAQSYTTRSGGSTMTFKHFYDAGTIGSGNIKFRHYSASEPISDVTIPEGYTSNFLLNDVPTTALNKTNIRFAVTTDTEGYYTFYNCIECVQDENNGYQINYYLNDTKTVAYNNGWVKTGFQNIAFSTGDSQSEVTIPSELWAWLQANGVRLSDMYTEVEVTRSGNYSVISNADKTKIYSVAMSFAAGYGLGNNASFFYDGSKWVSSDDYWQANSAVVDNIEFYNGSGSGVQWRNMRAVVGNTAASLAQLGVAVPYQLSPNCCAHWVCLIQGTQITLANGTKKPIEDITYDDELLVWNFYEGKFDTAKPCWIKVEQVAPEYNLCKFSNGAEIGFVGEGGNIGYHRIYNNQAKCFTHTGVAETPIGTTTFAEDMSMPTLIEQEVVKEEVKFYNIITDKHFNLFANGILTSCKLSNKYAIADMKYVGEQLISDEEERAYFERIENLKR